MAVIGGDDTNPSSSSSSTGWYSPPPKPSPPHSTPTPSPSAYPPPPQPPVCRPPPPRYGFHMLDRCPITLPDGTVGTYFALPPDYRDSDPPPFGLELGRMRMLLDGEDQLAHQRHQLLKYGNADPAVLKACFKFVKLLYQNPQLRNKYVNDGKPLQCLACATSSKDFQGVHALVLHIYYSDDADLRVDHLGLHRAICVLMGWNYTRPPNNTKLYQLLPADEVAANQDDLILWPPLVIIHNTNTGKAKDGRMEGLGNKTMDGKIRDMGFPGGKSKSLFSRTGHVGITLVKFSDDQSGLKEAMRLANRFEKGCTGRKDWARIQSIASEVDDESNPNLVLVDGKTGESRRILYGYLGTVSDIDKLDFDTRKKVVIESKHEQLQPPKHIYQMPDLCH